MHSSVFQDGGWGCFTDVDALSAGVLSVVSHVMEAVNTARHSKQAACQMACGRTVSCSIHTTQRESGRVGRCGGWAVRES